MMSMWMSLRTTTCSKSSVQPFSDPRDAMQPLQRRSQPHVSDVSGCTAPLSADMLGSVGRIEAEFSKDEQQQHTMLKSDAAAGWGAEVTWRSIAPVPSYTILPKMAPVSVDDTCMHDTFPRIERASSELRQP
jgi:hypothetical protein